MRQMVQKMPLFSNEVVHKCHPGGPDRQTDRPRGMHMSRQAVMHMRTITQWAKKIPHFQND